jgi:general secretion pathway protein D
VLGGMISNERETFQRRVPFLSEVPVLGQLFRYDSTDERRAEMLIILTPRVIRSQEEGERIKQSEFARMSWCAADVYDLYGDPGMDFRTDVTIPTDDPSTEVIYPDATPRGAPPVTPAPPVPGQYPGAAPGAGTNSLTPGQLPQPVPALPSGAARPDLNPALNSWNHARR